MLIRKAVLIQDMGEYLNLIRPSLNEILEYFTYTGIDEESAIKWIIGEEFELIYNLFQINHIHNHPVYLRVHQLLNEALYLPLSIITEHYLKAPQLYADNREIDLNIRGRDLYLSYFKSQSHLPHLRIYP